MSGTRFFAVLPAAGFSRRMGTPKLVLPFFGRPLVHWVAAAWRDAGVPRIAVVRRDDCELAGVLRSCGVELVRPATDPTDMRESVERALERARLIWRPRADDYWMLAPADSFGLSPEAIRRVMAACDATRPLAARADYGLGRRRHPVALQWKLAKRLQSLPSGRGVSHVLNRLEHVVEVDCRGVTAPRDIDTLSDYRQALLDCVRDSRLDPASEGRPLRPAHQFVN